MHWQNNISEITPEIVIPLMQGIQTQSALLRAGSWLSEVTAKMQPAAERLLYPYQVTRTRTAQRTGTSWISQSRLDLVSFANRHWLRKYPHAIQKHRHSETCIHENLALRL